jgi:hypothetical protein
MATRNQKSEDDADWRKFEKLVARIEQVLAPDAVVKSPDKIKDLVTGSRRDVDASIRLKVGSTQILITVECRKRSRLQDDTWIEQLATKKQKIGAARTIAVSSTPFSSPAVTTAALFGIDLRQVSQISADDIRAWAIPPSLVVYELVQNVVAFEVGMDLFPGDEGIQVHQGLLRVSGPEALDRPVFECPSDETARTLKYWTEVAKAGNREVLPPAGTKERRCVHLNVPPNFLFVETTRGGRCVKALRFTIELSGTTRRLELSVPTEVEYSDPHKPLLRHVSYTTKMDGREVSLSLQQETGSPAVGIHLEGMPALKELHCHFNPGPASTSPSPAPAPAPSPRPGPTRPGRRGRTPRDRA